MQRLAALMLLASAGPASGQPLWENVAVGMTMEELRRTQPRAEAPDTPSRMQNGAECLLQVTGHELGRHRFGACFYLLHGPLSQVILRMGSATEADVLSVVETLRARHGRERASRRALCRGGAFPSCEALWRLPERVELSVFWFGHTLREVIFLPRQDVRARGTINISYLPRGR